MDAQHDMLEKGPKPVAATQNEAREALAISTDVPPWVRLQTRHGTLHRVTNSNERQTAVGDCPSFVMDSMLPFTEMTASVA